MQAKLCATVTGTTTQELRAARDQVVGADLIELRLDYVHRPDVIGALADRSSPVVITCRPTWEGGQFDGSEEERRAFLTQALDLGAEYVDLEWGGGFNDLIRAREGRNIVLSTHEFKGMPNDLVDRYRAMRATGAEIVKVAVHVTKLSDMLQLRDIDVSLNETKRIVIGMGSAGIASRVLPDLFGSCWTYAGKGFAPGQIDLNRMIKEFRVRDITSNTEIYGVLGSPLGHSLSPVMHNAGFASIGRNAVYLPFEAYDVEDFLTVAKAFSVNGVSVTAPFKEKAVEHLSTYDNFCSQINAVNTLRYDKNGWNGINTDVPGFLEPLSSQVNLTNSRAAILGNGGAARAVAVALISLGVAVTIYGRNQEKSKEVARLVDCSFEGWPPPEDSWDLLVNTTPIGTYPNVNASPLPDGPFNGRIVYDLVYNPLVTRLLADASAAGCKTIGGLRMLVSQALRQFEWWTGKALPRQVFEKAVESHLNYVSN